MYFILINKIIYHVPYDYKRTQKGTKIEKEELKSSLHKSFLQFRKIK